MVKVTGTRGPDRDMSVRYRLFRRLLIYLGRLLFGFTVTGAEKVPKEGPLILASNHRQYADPVLVCMAVPRRIQWMGKKELFTPPFDRFFSFIGTFPVDRKKGGLAAIKAALNFLKAGWTLGIFPEGTRRQGYDPENVPKSGLAMLAARSGAPIFPVLVDRVPTPYQRFFANKKLHIHIGDPITTHNTSKARREGYYEEVAGEVLREIYALGDGEGFSGKGSSS